MNKQFNFLLINKNFKLNSKLIKHNFNNLTNSLINFGYSSTDPLNYKLKSNKTFEEVMKFYANYKSTVFTDLDFIGSKYFYKYLWIKYVFSVRKNFLNLSLKTNNTLKISNIFFKFTEKNNLMFSEIDSKLFKLNYLFFNKINKKKKFFINLNFNGDGFSKYVFYKNIYFNKVDFSYFLKSYYINNNAISLNNDDGVFNNLNTFFFKSSMPYLYDNFLILSQNFSTNLKNNIDSYLLISDWGYCEFLFNKNSLLIRSLLNIKFLRSIPEYQINDLILFFNNVQYSTTDVDENNDDNENGIYNENDLIIDDNLINIFFKIKRSIHVIRVLFLEFFSVRFKTKQKIDLYFFSFRSYSTLSYIWFLEYNILMFLIKIKLSNSIKFSNFIINNSLIFNNKINNFDRWTFITINTYTQFIICRWSFYKIFNQINIINNFIKSWSQILNTNKILQQKNIPLVDKKYMNIYTFKFIFFKFLESDYKIFTFILLPINNSKMYYNYILLLWFNYWNHKITTWKFLS